MLNTPRQILWADDEIDMLRPHILYLQSKGYAVDAVTNGEDAIQLAGRKKFDVVLLDEMMPGMGDWPPWRPCRTSLPTFP